MHTPVVFHRLVVIAFGIASLSLLQEANADSLLRWKFTEGESLRVVVEQTTLTQTTGSGKPTGINVAMTLDMRWTVESVDAIGTARLTQSFDRFAITMKSGTAEPIVFDSDSETKPSGPAANIANAVRPVIGVGFLVTMTARGAITEVKLSPAATEAFESVESPALKQLFSVAGISQLLGQSAVELPEQSVAVGSTWEKQSKTKSPLGWLVQDRTYTIAAVEASDEKHTEQIDIAGELVIDTAESTSKLKLVDQSLTGRMQFDTAAGRLLNSESIQKITTERPYREFKIKVETTATTKTTVALVAE